MNYSLLISFLLCVATTSYAEFVSQAGQDRYVYEHFFKDKKNGFFLDIGAHDGKTYSNTYFFEKELGWSGICFEPIPRLFEQLKQQRNCICINACVSAINGTVPFIFLDSVDEMLSGMKHTIDQRKLNIALYDLTIYGGECKEVHFPSVRLGDILDRYGVTTIDFLSLDTEGSELEILKTIDFNTYTIWVMTVENDYANPELREYVIAQGYELYGHVHVDDIFVHTDFLK